MGRPETAIVHYSAPPVVGGVEAVIRAHSHAFAAAGYPIAVIAGRGQADALPPGASFIHIPELDSRHPRVVEMSAELEQGQVPADFEEFSGRLARLLAPELGRFQAMIAHNVFTKRFNLPLTAALVRLLEDGVIARCVAWCHDFDWTSAHSRSKVHAGYPWDLLRDYRPDVTYVVVSQRRQRTLAGLLDRPVDDVHVVYDGVDPGELLALSDEGQTLIDRLGLLESDLVLLMPVRVTQAKNIEYAMRVTAALHAQDRQVELIITGPPDPHDEASMAYFRSLQDLRCQLGVERQVRFVFECGPEPDEGYVVGAGVVADLYRASDVMLMPSHREGFGMPVLEAGLLGMPVFCTSVPAAEEIGGEDVVTFDLGQEPAQVAARILSWADQSAEQRLRRRVRDRYTWQAILHRDILPLLGPAYEEGTDGRP